MSEGISRRSVLKTAGVGGLGLAGAGLVGAAAGAFRPGILRAAELDRLPRVAEGIRATDRAALGRDGVLKLEAAPALASRLVELRLSPGEGLEHLGADVVQVAAEFLCDPRRPNLLLEGATRVTYEVAEVAWQPGEGWPIYRHRAPCDDHAIGMRYAGVPRHQIVLMDDRAVYVGNAGPFGIIDGIRGPLRIDINGDAHAAHRGFYRVRITGLA